MSRRRRWTVRPGTGFAGLAGLAAAIVVGAAVGGGPSSAPAPAGGPRVPQPGMGKPLHELTPEQRVRFDLGRDLFGEPLLVADGLGPILNRPMCGACHIHPVRGGTGTLTVTRFGREEDGVFDPLEELGGSLLQMLAISNDCAEEIPAEANVVAERVVNGAFGYGLVEAIPDAAILALEREPPGISGRAHLVEALEAPGVQRVGRFGWKAQVATVLTFSADAARNEMGFTNRLIPEETDPNGMRPPALEACDDVPDPEDGPDGEGFHFIDRVTDFQRFLAPPPQTPRSGMTGEGLFASVGCTECHHPAFTTADDPQLEPALRDRPIRPYSDFLLHEMGSAADSIAQGDASGLELRTPPLWGLRTRLRLWHDGRFAGPFAERVAAAIGAHAAEGSEAADAGVMDAWAGLAAEERAAIVQFLASLGRQEFDADGNEVIVRSDFVAFAACFAGSTGDYTPDDACAISDIDQDGDVDADDYASFLLAYTGVREDCNENDVLDLDDILLGGSADDNGNGVPDECERCAADLDGDGVVGFTEILLVLGAWGPCLGEMCPEDLDDSDAVDFGDLLIILGAWGPCA